MKKKSLIMVLGFIVLVGFMLYARSQNVTPVQKKPVKLIRKKPLLSKYRFDVQGIKRIFTSPEKVVCRVQYYISPTYPKACFIGAYVPDKANWAPGFSYKTAGRLPDGVPKGQVHFVDNVTFEVHYKGSSFTSSTIEVAIYNKEKTLTTEVLQWGQAWSGAPRMPDLTISSITVSKYNPQVKTTFTINVKNIGTTTAGAVDIGVWLYKLLPGDVEPATPNEYWEGTVPMAGGTIAPTVTVPWTHDKYEFMVEGNWRVRAEINRFSGVGESDNTNNSFTYHFTLPN